MPRAHRLDFPGARHHVMNRGARRAPILAVCGARELFIELLSELPARFGCQVHAYALMGNHYHVLITSSDCPLERVMKRLNQAFTQRINHRFDWDGPVFRGRYHDVLVGHRDHWRHLLGYVHANPVRAGLPHRMADPLWTSHQAYLVDGPSWLATEPHLDEVGGRLGYAAWMTDIIEERVAPPSGFEPERWGGAGLEIRPAGYIDNDPKRLLAQLLSLWGSFEPKPGPDLKNCVGMWWLRANQVPVAEVARLFGTSTSTVTRRVDSLFHQMGDRPHVPGWMAALSGTDPRIASAA